MSIGSSNNGQCCSFPVTILMKYLASQSTFTSLVIIIIIITIFIIIIILISLSIRQYPIKERPKCLWFVIVVALRRIQPLFQELDMIWDSYYLQVKVNFHLYIEYEIHLQIETDMYQYMINGYIYILIMIWILLMTSPNPKYSTSASHISFSVGVLGW